jgi:hypothetical protein
MSQLETRANLSKRVKQEIDDLAKWYANNWNIAIVVRDDLQAIAILAAEEERKACAHAARIKGYAVLAEAIEARGKA